ncbi:MAG: hypothetical protein CMC15_18595 [Flavobacteriaceae bacterium]|nr:hypothetical protein [Flavobacteriaceae bacterium]|tara:strand:- start:74 stop:487 length:414 start_codon:yes stop_codon:yes gene_type:complete
MIKVKAKIIHGNVFEAYNPPKNTEIKPKFYIKFFTEEKCLEKFDTMRTQEGYYNANNKDAPLISVYDNQYEIFMNSVHIAKARNLSLDKCVMGMHCDLFLAPYSYESKFDEKRKTGFSTKKITLDAVEFYKRTVEDY